MADPIAIVLGAESSRVDTMGMAIVPDVDPRIRITVGTAVAVTLSHWLVERPALALKHRWA